MEAALPFQDLEKKDSNPEKSDDEAEKKAENDEEEVEEEEYDEEDIEEVVFLFLSLFRCNECVI